MCAMRLNAGDFDRKDLFQILPEHILADDADNPRQFAHSPEEIEALARSILKHGQQQNCVVRRIEDNKVRLVSGFGRRKAVLYINQHLKPKTPIKLKCIVVECSGEEAFERAVVENLERAETTPVDDAHAQRTLREIYGWPEEKIATLYKKSVSHLHKLRKLPTLEKPIQEAVAKGTLSVDAAVDLAQMPEKDRAEIVEAAKEESASGAIETKPVKEKARQHRERTGTTRIKALSAKEIKDFYDSLTGEDSDMPVRELGQRLLNHAKGETSNAELGSWIDEFLKPLCDSHEKKGKGKKAS